MKVQFHPLNDQEDQLKYVVIQTRYQGQWVYCKHEKRSTFETPGGHIEEGESALKAAKRELFEETGAQEFSIEAVCDYSVTVNDQASLGRMYLADVTAFDDIPQGSEIESISFQPRMPDHLTYPAIQPLLYDVVGHFIKGKPLPLVD